ncbi:MAG: BMC domain-containing protein [Alphaproteobacteria bacterium]|nr:BMC domain-containing protein [Alphaproteobacteria bacterium]
MADALALLEVDSVALGLRVLDALVKRSPVTVLEANLVEPGRFLLLFAGGVAEVEEADSEAREVAEGGLLDQLLLPLVHQDLLAGLRGHEARAADYDSLGVVEGRTVASTLHACDRALKDADVALVGLRVAGGLAGRAYFVVHGLQHDVQASLDAAGAVLDDRGARHRVECIPRPHPDMIGWILRPAPFQPGLPQGQERA